MAFNENSLTIPSAITPVVPYPTLNLVPVEAFGAIGDAYYVQDGAITGGLKALTSPGNHFVRFSGSKAIVVNDAGPVVNGLSTDLITTGVFVSTGSITLTDAATVTVSGAKVTLGTDNAVFIQNAMNSTDAPTITLMNGLYLTSKTLIWPAGKNLLGSGTPLSGNAGLTGIVGPGELYASQASIPTDPVAGVGGVGTVNSATQSGNTATYTLSATAPSWLTVGSVVTVAGMTPAGYNFTNTVLSVVGSTFTMLLPTTGLGASSVGGTATSQAGKRYVVINAGGSPLGPSVATNLNFNVCNDKHTVPWGCLWPNVGPSQAQWEYHFDNCIFTGYVGRHLMWQNFNLYSKCIFIGRWAGDAWTCPVDFPNKGNVQKVLDVGCVLSQTQAAFGQLHYEYNSTTTTSSFSAWYFAGSMEGGYSLGNFTGNSYVMSAVHIEALSSPQALFMTVAGAPNLSSGIWLHPDLHLTVGQQASFIVASGSTGQSPGWACLNTNTLGVPVLCANQIIGAGVTTTANTLINYSSTPTNFTTGIDLRLNSSGSNNTAVLQSMGTGANTALFLSAVNGSTNTALSFGNGFIFSSGTTVLPTSNPHVVGQWWNNAGVINVSAG